MGVETQKKLSRQHNEYDNLDEQLELNGQKSAEEVEKVG